MKLESSIRLRDDECFVDTYRERGYRQVMLSVIEGNDDTIHLYEKSGFRAVARRRYGRLTRRAGLERVLIVRRPL